MVKLLQIQKLLKAPKGQYNSFGKYKYRSCEDIIEAVKPICFDNKAIITLSDELVMVGERYYVKATATLFDVETNQVIASTTAYAREELDKKGMDGSQITGTASSYARKYALNGLLQIDDTKDADSNEYHSNELDKALIKEAEELNIDLVNVAKYLKKDVSQLTNDELRSCIERKKKAKGGQ